MFLRRSVKNFILIETYFLHSDDVATNYNTLCQVANLTQMDCSRQVRSQFAQGNLPCSCEQRCHDDYWAVQVNFYKLIFSSEKIDSFYKTDFKVLNARMAIDNF